MSRSSNFSWRKTRFAVECCKECKPPKRFPGCGSSCKEYKEQKAKYLADKKREKEKHLSYPTLTIYDFNKH